MATLQPRDCFGLKLGSSTCYSKNKALSQIGLFCMTNPGMAGTAFTPDHLLSEGKEATRSPHVAGLLCSRDA